MTLAIYLVSALFFFTAFTCHVLVVQHAFRASTKSGLLCLLLPPYALFYYAFVKFQHRRRKAILTFGIVLGTLSVLGFATAHQFASSPDDDAQSPGDGLADW